MRNQTLIPDGAAQNFAIAEFNALRTEIIESIKLQYQLMLGAVLALGTLSTITFTKESGSPIVILLYPWLGLVLTATWSKLDVGIARAGQYIQKHVERVLSAAMPTAERWGWENSLTKNRLDTALHKVLDGAPQAIFLGTQLIAIYAPVFREYVWSRGDSRIWYMSWVPVALTIILLGVVWIEVRIHLRPNHQAAADVSPDAINKPESPATDLTNVKGSDDGPAYPN